MEFAADKYHLKGVVKNREILADIWQAGFASMNFLDMIRRAKRLMHSNPEYREYGDDPVAQQSFRQAVQEMQRLSKEMYNNSYLMIGGMAEGHAW